MLQESIDSSQFAIKLIKKMALRRCGIWRTQILLAQQWKQVPFESFIQKCMLQHHGVRSSHLNIQSLWWGPSEARPAAVGFHWDQTLITGAGCTAERNRLGLGYLSRVLGEANVWIYGHCPCSAGALSSCSAVKSALSREWMYLIFLNINVFLSGLQGVSVAITTGITRLAVNKPQKVFSGAWCFVQQTDYQIYHRNILQPSGRAESSGRAQRREFRGTAWRMCLHFSNISHGRIQTASPAILFLHMQSSITVNK